MCTLVRSVNPLEYRLPKLLCPLSSRQSPKIIIGCSLTVSTCSQINYTPKIYDVQPGVGNSNFLVVASLSLSTLLHPSSIPSPLVQSHKGGSSV